MESSGLRFTSLLPSSLVCCTYTLLSNCLNKGDTLSPAILSLLYKPNIEVSPDALSIKTLQKGKNSIGSAKPSSFNSKLPSLSCLSKLFIKYKTVSLASFSEATPLVG